MDEKNGAVSRILRVAQRECGILAKTPIYLFCMVIFPILCIFLFTSMMDIGQPQEMPVGIVDLDNTSTTRTLIRRLDAMQTSRVTSYYNSPAEARKAMQQNKIYAFLYFPKGTTQNLLAARQPKVSFYYNGAYFTAGALLMRDLKTVTTLGSAAVGQATLQAKGYTDRQIQTALQPIAMDLHLVGNPWTNYDVYLTTFIVPGILLLFILLISAYCLGTELKFNRSKELMKVADGDVYAAVVGKFLPHTLIWLTIIYGYLWYILGHLHFPHEGDIGVVMLLGLITVLAAEGFAIFMFGIIPSLRMSMSICSLWGVLSFSTCGAAFPVFAMDAPLTALSSLFPLRHYCMIYQLNIFNGHPIEVAWFNYMTLGIFICLPFFVMRNIRKAMLEYEYIP